MANTPGKEKSAVERIDNIMDKPAVERVDDINASLENDEGRDVQHSSLLRQIMLKQDLSIVLILSGCYFFAYLDRGALGNARIMEFQKDLGLDNSQFYNCLLMFCKYSNV